MRHVYQVVIVDASDGVEIPIAKRSTREKAEAQAENIRAAFGAFARNAPAVIVQDLRD